METCAGHNGEAASECPLLLMRNGNKRFGDLEEKGQELSQFYSFPGQNRTKAASSRAGEAGRRVGETRSSAIRPSAC